MSLLTDNMPCTITVDGAEYKINTDLKTWLKVDEIIFSQLSETDKAIKMLSLCFNGNNIPPKFTETISELLKFYACKIDGEEIEDTADSKNQSKKPVYSFSHDADYIYSAFLTQYGIDLLKEKTMNWRRFIALFRGLEQERKIMEIIGYRSLDLSKIKDREQKQHYRQLKNAYKLPDYRSQSEKDNEMAIIFNIFG